MAAMLNRMLRDQAAGLSELQLQPVTRVLPVVQSASGKSSVDLVRRIETILDRLGLTVAVVQSRGGLSRHDVGRGYRAALAHWLQDSPPGAVVLLHAPVQALAVALVDSPARPLIALGTSAPALADAYHAIDVFTQVAGLLPVVLELAQTDPTRAARWADALQAQCRKQWSVVPAIWTLGYHAGSKATPAHAEESCALKLLDTALVLEGPPRVTDQDLICMPRAQQFPTHSRAGATHVHR